MSRFDTVVGASRNHPATREVDGLQLELLERALGPTTALPTSVITAKAVLGAVCLVFNRASRSSAQVLSVGWVLNFLNMASCTMRKGNLP